MTRRTVRANGKTDWFDDDSVREKIPESTRWEEGMGSRIGVCSGMQINRAYLMLTEGGRWVLHEDQRPEYDGPDRYEWLTDDQAKAWLVRSAEGHDDNAEVAEEALQRLWPDLPEESGPKGGRPAIGPAISVSYQPDLLKRVDAAAAKAGLSRAAWLRQAAEKAL
ncbi:hypothetical protein GCM10010400_49240 [Streptomyces aculeolatus]|uniref:ribbon-helix-helix domain-containing protein n=1 Tax=Streptomyces aculeolatus TaxID=270689 RepID=UPI001CEC92DE|nr:CopG family transcriptional regulator [Streptomyces aculeolatus]